MGGGGKRREERGGIKKNLHVQTAKINRKHLKQRDCLLIGREVNTLRTRIISSFSRA